MERKIVITEKQYNRLFLTEGKDRKQMARKRTRDVIRNHFHNNLILDQTTNATNGMTLCDYLESQIMEQFFHDRLRSDAKGTFVVLEPMVANIALNAGWNQGNYDESVINRLHELLGYMESLYSEGKFDPKSLPLDSTINDLNEMFGKVLDQQRAASKEERSKKIYKTNENYIVYNDVQYEQAKSIGDYSYGGLKLCYTQKKSTWEKYTNEGKNKVYVCLTKNWKNIKEKHSECLMPKYASSKDAQKDNYYDNNGDTESSPYDAYGLSMIFLFINPEGNLVYSNTRWNHQAAFGNGRTVDQAFTEDDISELLGVNFEQRFPGYTPDELKEKGIHYVPFNKIQNLLDSGIDWDEIFDNYSMINDSRKIKALVWVNDAYNYITKENKLLMPNQWFDKAYRKGYYGWYIVRMNSRENFINEDGDFFGDTWYLNVTPFNTEGWAIVTFADENASGYNDNAVNLNHEYFSSENYPEVEEVRNNLMIVCFYNDTFNIVRRDGSFLLKNNAINVQTNNKDEFIIENGNYEYNILTSQGQYLSDIWFDEIEEEFGEFVCVKKEDKFNLLKRNGELASPNLWFDNIINDEREIDGNDYWVVGIHNKWNLLNGNGILSKYWFDDVTDDYNCNNTAIKVKKNNKENFLKSDGTLLSKEFYHEIRPINRDLYLVVDENDKENLLNNDGKLLYSQMWFDDLFYYFSTGFKGWIGDKVTLFNRSGQWLTPNMWFTGACEKEFQDGIIAWYAVDEQQNQWRIEDNGKMYKNMKIY